jgi:mannose-1-phosphate guanylyltransferase
MNVVIMAGGGGSRLWPLSRQHRPKQFLDLGSGKTLLEHAYHRAATLADSQRIYVATTEQYREQVRQLLPHMPADNMFYEPARRDTGPAFAAAAVALRRRDRQDEPTIFMWSDHIFTNESEFLADLKKIPRLVEEHPDAVIIIGHRPTSSETGLGYLEVGEVVGGYDDVFHVRAFKEKPDQKTAEQYLAAGNYFWNMAYVSLRPSFLLSELRKYEAKLVEGINQYDQAIVRGDAQRAAAIYQDLPSVSIDYALLERTPHIIAVTGDYGWSDVGNWAAVKDVFGTNGDHIPAGHHIHIDSQNNYVYNATDRAVSLIGMMDSIVVVTEDAVLVTNRQHSHKVKDVVQRLEEEGKEEFL